MSKHLFNLIAAVSVSTAAFGAQTSDERVLVLKTRDGVVIQGYDAVAYFTDNQPVKGSSRSCESRGSCDFGAKSHSQDFGQLMPLGHQYEGNRDMRFKLRAINQVGGLTNFSTGQLGG